MALRATNEGTLEGQPAEPGWLHPSWDINTQKFKILIFGIMSGGEREPDRAGFYVRAMKRAQKPGHAGSRPPPSSSCSVSASDCYCPGHGQELVQKPLLVPAPPPGPCCGAQHFGFPQKAQPGGDFVPPLCLPRQAGLSGKREQTEHVCQPKPQSKFT